MAIPTWESVKRNSESWAARSVPGLKPVIRLYYLEGLTNREIATALNIEPDSVTRQRLRAIMALRKMKIAL